MTSSATHRTIQAVWKFESPKLHARLTRMLRDVGLAEEVAQDAFVAALEHWPTSGIPENPGAWLMTTAKRRSLNLIQRTKLSERKHEALSHTLDVQPDMDLDDRLDDDIGDDLLRLMFISCHPILPREGRIALTLRLLGGLTTEEIARAFLISEPTIAQRIVRAKRLLAEERVPFEVPRGEERALRLSSVLEVIYLVFNEGYSANAGEDPMRPQLVEDALRLGRVLTGIAANDAEAHGLIALMELHASRIPARLDREGMPVLLPNQNRGKWDPLLIRRGLDALRRAESIGEARGPYAIQAAISACHARAKAAEETDWAHIARLYGALYDLTPSPIVELNRAMAVSMAEGPAAGLAIIDALTSQPALASYHWLPSARADLLVKLGRRGEARVEFERAASLAGNALDRRLLLERAQACADASLS